MSTYEMNRDGIADLGLDDDLEQALIEARNSEDGSIITDEIDELVSREIDRHGGIDADGMWPGVWSTYQIVTDVLIRHEFW